MYHYNSHHVGQSRKSYATAQDALNAAISAYRLRGFLRDDSYAGEGYGQAWVYREDGAPFHEGKYVASFRPSP